MKQTQFNLLSSLTVQIDMYVPQRKAHVIPTPAQMAGALQYPNSCTAMKAKYPAYEQFDEVVTK